MLCWVCLVKGLCGYYSAAMRDSQHVTIEINPGEKSAPITLAEFPSEILKRFSEILQCELKPDSSLDLDLRTVATSYQAQKNDTNKTARAAKRSRQRKAAKTTQKALDAIGQLQTGDVVPLIIEGKLTLSGELSMRWNHQRAFAGFNTTC